MRFRNCTSNFQVTRSFSSPCLTCHQKTTLTRRPRAAHCCSPRDRPQPRARPSPPRRSSPPPRGAPTTHAIALVISPLRSAPSRRAPLLSSGCVWQTPFTRVPGTRPEGEGEGWKGRSSTVRRTRASFGMTRICNATLIFFLGPRDDPPIHWRLFHSCLHRYRLFVCSCNRWESSFGIQSNLYFNMIIFDYWN